MVQLAGPARLQPAFSPAWAPCEKVLNPAGSGPVLCKLIAAVICRSAGGSVVVLPGVPPDPVPDADTVGVVLPCAEPGLPWFSSTTAAPAPAPSRASTSSPIFHHRPERRRWPGADPGGTSERGAAPDHCGGAPGQPPGPTVGW